MRGLVVLVRGLVLGLVLAAACTGAHSPPHPDEACAATCAERIARCDKTECERGCGLALDRLVEDEGAVVLSCVEKSTAVCDDWLWAECAARVGPHKDGGPAAPVPGPRH